MSGKLKIGDVIEDTFTLMFSNGSYINLKVHRLVTALPDIVTGARLVSSVSKVEILGWGDNEADNDLKPDLNNPYQQFDKMIAVPSSQINDFINGCNLRKLIEKESGQEGLVIELSDVSKISDEQIH